MDVVPVPPTRSVVGAVLVEGATEAGAPVDDECEVAEVVQPTVRTQTARIDSHRPTGRTTSSVPSIADGVFQRRIGGAVRGRSNHYLAGAPHGGRHQVQERATVRRWQHSQRLAATTLNGTCTRPRAHSALRVIATSWTRPTRERRQPVTTCRELRESVGVRHVRTARPSGKFARWADLCGHV